MADWYFGTVNDDYVVRVEWWFPGQGISIYDGGLGYDTIDFSDNPDSMIYFAYPLGWVQDPSIPLGYDEELGQDIFAYALIGSFEHLIAGAGNDTIYAADSAMTLDGGLGNDIFLYAANHFDDGDHFEGNLGDDILDFSADDFGCYVFDLVGETITDDHGWIATISGIENVTGSWGDDTLILGADTNYLNGHVGHDFFDLSAGILTPQQTFIGGSGSDTLSFTDRSMAFYLDLSLGVMTWGADAANFAYVYEMETVLAGGGNDNIIGTDFYNEVFGGGGDDRIDGLGGRDLLYGESGDDTILGGSGRDKIYGGSGRDKLSGGAQKDVIFGNGGDDEILGGGGHDTQRGGGGADTLRGENGRDRLSGGTGDDRLKGGAGQDLLIGGVGNDILLGGDDSDSFRFSDAHGNDTIADFDAADALEQIDFSRLSTINDMSDLIAMSVDTAGGALIATGASSSLLLSDVVVASLDSTDFIFV